jgi:hypothetical protein
VGSFDLTQSEAAQAPQLRLQTARGVLAQQRRRHKARIAVDFAWAFCWHVLRTFRWRRRFGETVPVAGNRSTGHFTNRRAMRGGRGSRGASAKKRDREQASGDFRSHVVNQSSGERRYNYYISVARGKHDFSFIKTRKNRSQ